MQSYTLNELARICNLELKGNNTDSVIIESVTSLTSEKKNALGYIEHEKFYSLAQNSKVAAILIPKELKYYSFIKPVLISENPVIDFIKISNLFLPKLTKSGIHPSAIISPSAIIGNNVFIDQGVFIGNNVVIGDSTLIYASSWIGDNVCIGKNCLIHPFVVIANSILEDDIEIFSHAAIGLDGFGFKFDGSKWLKVPHFGSVKIDSGCSIGSYSSINRGTYENTVIKKGVKFDAHVHIAHNVEVGEHTILAAYSAVAGSSKLGDYCTLGGRVIVADHLQICSHVTVLFGSVVSRSIRVPGVYGAHIPALPYRQWQRVFISIIKAFSKDVKEL
ncbi:MAG: UDP-3-O-(3-hydroxymyristoyl)glucosamine N-acyltransferase [Methylacidiphilales bacterium]|nr:UDP-3-O-(3-hydroxymyristoyl)glucosamine N-acyltransferase [Candidatus Methylacidiphilales bacterium]